MIYVHTDTNFISGKFPEFLDMRYFNITQYKKAPQMTLDALVE